MAADRETCESVETLNEFLTGALSGERAARIADHLETCAACAGRLEQLQGRDVGETRAGLEVAIEDASTQPRPRDAMPSGLRGKLYQLRGCEPWEAEEFCGGEGGSIAGGRSRFGGEFPSFARGDRFGRYVLLRQLGRGGHGTVFLARDESLGRDVALKIPRRSLLDAEAREIFLREGRAAGRLQHPNLVLVLEAGEVDGMCFLALAYCPGPTLAEWLREFPSGIPADTAATLVAKLADAVAHAHWEGVLHRDIKPSNVIMEDNPRSPGGEREPKLTDFGVAKLSDQEGGTTGTGVVVGTLPYMPPEQASGLQKFVGPGVDIYALGVLLYELLTGQHPHRGESPAETFRRILQEEPARPRQLAPGTPRDIEAICLKCLEKDPRRRYAAASDLADDLRRFLERRPTLARPLSGWEQTRRWVARHRAVAAILSLTGLLLLASGVGTALHFHRMATANAALGAALTQANDARRQAEEAEGRLREELYATDLGLAGESFAKQDLWQMKMLLDRHLPEAGHDDLRDFAWRYLRGVSTSGGRTWRDSESSIYRARWAPDGVRFAAVGADGTLRLYDRASQRAWQTIAAGQGELNGVDFHPTRPWLAVAGDDGGVAIWDWQSGKRIRHWKVWEKPAYNVLFTPDGAQLVACGNDPVIYVWNTDDGALVRELRGHSEAVDAIAMAPSGQRLASASYDRTAAIWNLRTGELERRLTGHSLRLLSIAFSPDSRRIATGSVDRSARVWEVETGDCEFVAPHPDAVSALAFSPRQEELLTGDCGGIVRAWRRDPSGDWSLTPRSVLGESNRVWSLDLGPREQLLLAESNGIVECWDEFPRPATRRLDAPLAATGLGNFAFSTDGRDVWVVSRGEGVRRWRRDSADQGAESSLVIPDSDAQFLGLLSDRRLGVGLREGGTRIYSLESADLTQELAIGAARHVVSRFHPDRRRGRSLLYLGGGHPGLIAWDETTGQVSPSEFADKYDSVAVSSDGRRMALAAKGNAIEIWNLETGQKLGALAGHRTTVPSLAFSRDGQWLASASHDRLAILWDLATMKPLRTLVGHPAEAWSVAFSPDGKTVATTSKGVYLWNVATGRKMLELANDAEGFRHVAFSPAGDCLAAIHYGGKYLLLFEPRSTPPVDAPPANAASDSVSTRPAGPTAASSR